MIISHRHRCIFITTHATAGASIEIALSRNCGPDDVITPLSPGDEMRRREIGGRGPQNYVWPQIPFPVVCEILHRTQLPSMVSRIGRWFEHDASFQAYKHIPASCVRRLLHPEIWQRYFKFCVERNPLDKVRAGFAAMQAMEPNLSIDEFIRSGRYCELADFSLYTEQGQLLVDRIYPFETIEEWWPEVCKRFGIEPAGLPRATGDNRYLSEPLSREAQLQVGVEFAREIRLLGY